MQKVKINGKPYDFPVSVNDLTLKHFFDLRQCKDLIDEISVLTDIERETILNFKDVDTIRAARVLTESLKGSILEGFENIKLPKQVIIGEKTIRVPKELRLQPIGAFMAVSDLLGKHSKLNRREATDYTICIPKTLAHYFYKPYFGDDVIYNEDKAEADSFMGLIMQMKVVEAVPVANFFFRRFPNLT